MTTIEWTKAPGYKGVTWNPLRGCSHVSEGCRNCYAATMAHRYSGTDKAGKELPYHGLTRMTPHGARWTGEVRLVPDMLDLPLRWKQPRMVFVNSMSDLFHESVPDEFIQEVVRVMWLAGQKNGSIFQILTKRAERAARFRPKVTAGDSSLKPMDLLDGRWPSNVWLVVSVENQETADERVPYLLQVPAAVRGLSMEPLLGPVDLSRFKPFDGECFCQDRPDGCCPRMAAGCPVTAIDWIIVGGESGPRARPMHPDWVRSIRDQTKAAGVPFFFKQWGEWAPSNQVPPTKEAGKKITHYTRGIVAHGGKNLNVYRFGKKLSGALLDGREHREWPKVAQMEAKSV